MLFNIHISCASYGFIKNIHEFEIEHMCSTEAGSSGGPIILLNTFKVIGVHKGTSRNKGQIKFGTLLRYPILDFNATINNNLKKMKNINTLKEESLQIIEYKKI